MKLRFEESQITNIASRYIYTREEEHLLKLQSQIERKCCLTKDQLRLIAKWKSPRSASHVEKNTHEYIEEVTSIAISAKNERTRIEVLTNIDGVSWPTA